MRIVIEGVKILADNSMILGPSPSTPVAFEESSLLMYDSTWSHVISGILRKIFSKRLHVMVKCCNRWRSESGDSSWFLSRISQCYSGEVLIKLSCNISWASKSRLLDETVLLSLSPDKLRIFWIRNRIRKIVSLCFLYLQACFITIPFKVRPLLLAFAFVTYPLHMSDFGRKPFGQALIFTCFILIGAWLCKCFMISWNQF